VLTPPRKPYRPRNKRLDPALYAQANWVTFITVCALRPAAPFVAVGFNQDLIETLRTCQSQDSCLVFTYCLMPDHLHFLVCPQVDGASVLTFTERFKGRVTPVARRHGWRGRLWQERYYDHIVRKDEDLRQIAIYILNNPVRKGLVERAKDWRWGGHMNPLPVNPAAP